MNRREFLMAAAGLPIVGLPMVASASSGRKNGAAMVPTVAFSGNKVNISGVGLKAPLKLLVAGDTHFGFHDKRDDENADYYKRMAQYAAPKEPFEKMLAKAKERKVDALLLLGDIISFPTLANVDYVHGALEASGLNYLYTAGNHDWHFEGISGSDIEQRDEWIEKRLKPLYRKQKPLMYSKMIGGLRVVMIDNSVYHILPEQLEFWRTEAAKGDPIMLCMHIPLWMLGYGEGGFCAAPKWGAQSDKIWQIERRQRWAEKAMPSTSEFREAVFATPNLVAIFAGHEHQLMFATESGKMQIVVPSNRDGSYFQVEVK